MGEETWKSEYISTLIPKKKKKKLMFSKTSSTRYGPVWTYRRCKRMNAILTRRIIRSCASPSIPLCYVAGGTVSRYGMFPLSLCSPASLYCSISAVILLRRLSAIVGPQTEKYIAHRKLRFIQRYVSFLMRGPSSVQKREWTSTVF